MERSIGKERETCVVKIAELINHYAGTDLEKRRLFFAGFWIGECEKVRETPPAAMFRPPLARDPWALEEIPYTAGAFGLVAALVAYNDICGQCDIEELTGPPATDMTKLMALIQIRANTPGWHQELWVSRPKNVARIRALPRLQVNSTAWHRERGLLCGIPEEEIDPQFHLREGYGKFADEYKP